MPTVLPGELPPPKHGNPRAKKAIEHVHRTAKLERRYGFENLHNSFNK